MLQSLAAKSGFGLHASVERSFVQSKGCFGLRCQEGYSFRPGEVLAVVPFWCCPSPLVALASPWGTKLDTSVGSYHAVEGRLKVEFPRDSAVTAVFTALAMEQGSPIQAYLRYIEPSVANSHWTVSASSSAAATATQADQLVCIERLTDEVAAALLQDVRSGGVSMDADRLRLAMRLCQSRCMDVPDSDAVFGGPALVPIADLVNHDDAEPNVAVTLVTDSVMRGMVKKDRATGDRTVDTRPVSAHCPFFCVMVATEDVHGETELTYQYVSQEDDPRLFNDPLFWASRFHIHR